MAYSSLLFPLLGLAWAGYEVWLGRHRRAAAGESRDQGTLGLLWRSLLLALAVAVALRVLGWGRAPTEWQPALRWAGCLLMAGGLSLRVWAIHALARFFTVDVGIRADHQLVQRGPYRWLRHPSYTGVLLCFYGLGIGLGNIGSLVVLAAVVTWAFLRRIAVEETALRAAFPLAYPAYAARTWRLFPGW